MNAATLLRLSFLYLIVLGIFLVGSFLSNLITIASIQSNLVQSVNTLEQEGLYPVSFGNKYSDFSFLVRDQYTDCLMLNEAASVDAAHPLASAILSPCLKSGRGVEMMPDDLRQVSQGTMKPNVNYDWYWHGYLVVLRPLLVFFDYAQIRWINCGLMLILVLWVLWLMAQRLGMICVILSAGLLFAMHFETVPYTMQYVSVFFVTFIATGVLLKWNYFFAKRNNDVLAFFAIGAVTVFLDFLTVPIVSLGIPLLFWLLVKKGETAKWKDVIVLSIAWGAGYTLLWMSKWAVCAMTFDPSVLTNAASHAEKWSVNASELGRLGMTIGVLKKYVALVWSMNWGWGLIVAAGMMKLLPKTKNWKRENSWILLIALMPMVWSLVLVNHNYAHFGFTWRLISVSLFAVAIWVYKCIDWKKLI